MNGKKYTRQYRRRQGMLLASIKNRPPKQTRVGMLSLALLTCGTKGGRATSRMMGLVQGMMRDRGIVVGRGTTRTMTRMIMMIMMMMIRRSSTSRRCIMIRRRQSGLIERRRRQEIHYPTRRGTAGHGGRRIGGRCSRQA